MPKIILLTSGTVQMEAELNESKTAALLLDKLPLSGIVNTWGDSKVIPSCGKKSNRAAPLSWKKLKARHRLRRQEDSFKIAIYFL